MSNIDRNFLESFPGSEQEFADQFGQAGHDMAVPQLSFEDQLFLLDQGEEPQPQANHVWPLPPQDGDTIPPNEFKTRQCARQIQRFHAQGMKVADDAAKPEDQRIWPPLLALSNIDLIDPNVLALALQLEPGTDFMFRHEGWKWPMHWTTDRQAFIQDLNDFQQSAMALLAWMLPAPVGDF
jgi:hypothetical protein